MRFLDILLIATLATGLIWWFDVLFLRDKRMLHVLSGPKSRAPEEPLLVEYAKAFFPILLIVFLLRSFVAEPFRIPSGSMRPTLLEGDFILVNKFDYGLRIPILNKTFLKLGEPKRGDIIVFKHDRTDRSMDMIKRVVGLPGDHIQYRDKVLYINGEPAKQDFVRDKEEPSPFGGVWTVKENIEHLGDIDHKIYVGVETPVTLNQRRHPEIDVVVPEDSYFVLGDNRDNSIDSRYWGFVQNGDILGKAMLTWMSWDSDNHSIRWNRIGKTLYGDNSAESDNGNGNDNGNGDKNKNES